MQSREITLIQSSIDNGRIYFPTTDVNFFPADSLADRKGDGHKGATVTLVTGNLRIETDIRISSSTRLSPRKTFASYLKSLSATAGMRLIVTRLNEREYLVEPSSSPASKSPSA